MYITHHIHSTLHIFNLNIYITHTLYNMYVIQVLGLYKDKKISTNKAVLEKCDNPISTLVISWRKLNAARTKVIIR